MRAYTKEFKKLLEERDRKYTIKRLTKRKALKKMKSEAKIPSPPSSQEEDFMLEWNVRKRNF